MKYILPALLMCITGMCTHAQNILTNSSFGDNGVVTKSPEKKDNAFWEQATSVIELPDEKLLVAVEVNGVATLLARHLPDGTQDKTYGKNGFSEPIQIPQARAVRRDDGKVLLVGFVNDGGKGSFVIQRYDHNGQPDPTFGDDGGKTIPIQTTITELKKAVLQNDGKIILAGTVYTSGETKGFVLRLNADGSFDTSFGAAGLLVITTAGISRISDLILNESKILIGTSYSAGGDQDFALIQYLEDGRPDQDFGNNGQVTVNNSPGDAMEAMALQKDGKIIFSGATGQATYFRSGVAVVRLFPDGKLDSTFNLSGIASVNFDSYNHLLRSVVVDANGEITIAGALQGPVIGLTFARLSNDGSLDMNYGDAGKKLIVLGNPTTLDLSSGVLTKNGAFVCAGLYNYYTPDYFYSPFDYLLVRIKTTGQPDEHFGTNGLATAFVPGKNSQVSFPVQSPDGSILLKYFALEAKPKDGLVRLHPNGTQDQNFGEEGVLKIPVFNYGYLTFGSLPDGRVVTFSDGRDPVTNIAGILMRRFTTEGKPDLSFGDGGRRMILSVPTGGTTFNGLAIQHDGQILITGTIYSSSSPQQGFLMQLTGDGNIDQGFGSGGRTLFNLDQHEYPLEPLVQPDGKIVVKGLAFQSDGMNDYSFIKRFDSEGKLDESFGKKGVIRIDKPGYINKLFIQSDKRLVATFSFRDDNGAATNVLLRYFPDGTLDTEFGEKGSVKIPTTAAALLKNDKILFNNTNNTTAGKSNIALVLLNADGSIDKSFGTNGTKFFLIGDSDNKFSELNVQNDNVFITGVRHTGLDQEGILANLRILYETPSDTMVSGFILVNASANKDIQNLNEGDVLDLTTLPRATLNIRANTSPATVGSVVFELTGPRKHKCIENGAPYALFSDNKGNYFGGALPEGEYRLTATPYSGRYGKGTKGSPLTIRFKVVYPAAVARLVLVNAQTGDSIQEIRQGSILRLSQLPSSGVSIRAITSPDTVGSVAFELQGQQNHQQVENILPYALFGDKVKQYNVWTPQPGSYSLKATPYSAVRKGGTPSKELSVQFKIVEMQAACDSPSFAPVVSIRTSAGGYEISVADFNKDDKPDMAVLESYSSSIGILLGTGDGGFNETTPCSTGGKYPTTLTAGDFNRDGKADLIITNVRDFSESGTIGVLLGKGDGSFAQPINYLTGIDHPYSILTDDFNHDGKQDIAVMDYSPSTVNILLGNGDGSFGAKASYSSGGYAPRFAAVGDFNQDGNKDFAVSYSYTNTIGVMLGKSDGSFAGVSTYVAGSSSVSELVVGDLNSDGKQDLVFLNDYGPSIGVLIGKGDGSFAGEVRYPAGRYGINSLALDDFNGDGISDVALGINYTTTVDIMLGRGDGSFANPVAFPAYFRGSLTVADFNSDGRKDLTFSSQVSGVGVLLNNCNAAVPPAVMRVKQPLVAANEKGMMSLSASPNPFSSQSIARFSVPVEGYASLSLYNTTGIEVKRLFQGQAEKDREYRIAVESKGLAAGVYLLRLASGEKTTTTKIVLLK